ncbi:MAG: hypothetical protein DMF88_09490 [Acidobacteria bacterium]|nr:MAG: hypothetical protein DMF88_09490 [Acidobacteriota bacterium]
MRTVPIVPVALLVLFCVIGPIAAQAGQNDSRTVRAERRLPAVRASAPIKIDGALDEADWDRAPVARGFIQSDPHEGEPATHDTDVRVLYDANNIYVGVFAHDPDPRLILTSELSKDFNRESGDDFEIVLDTFHDERNGYVFATNAHGAKWDAQMINEGLEVNENWDALWDVATRITDTGWYAEIVIPFRTLRFRGSDEQTWGINFQRRIRRLNEDSFWAPVPRIYDLDRVSLAGTLEGLQGVRPGNDLRVKPYVLGSAGTSSRVDVGTDAQAGLDVKYGVTSGLTWDFTVNTDFSQVEADEQQVNLTRFSLFFPEKRDFFLENSGIFQFGQGRGVVFGGGGLTSGRQTDAILFFSRRIGLSGSGESIPIGGGTRLTGRFGNYSIGVLNLQQREGTTTSGTNFTALRLRRNVLANSDVGVILLNKNENGPLFNRAVGADANFRFFNSLDVNASAARTMSPTSAVAGSGSESMGNASFHYRDRRWELQSTYVRIGDRFNDEMGFVPRTGIWKFDSTYGARFRPPRLSKWLREIFPHLGVTNVSWLNTGELQSRLIGIHTSINDPTSENLIIPFRINRRRGITIPIGRYDFNDWHATWRTNASAPFSVNGRVDVGDFYDGHKQSYAGGAALRLAGRLNASITESRNQIQLGEGSYTTDLISARIEYGFSTIAFANALIQYNTDAQEWTSNLRFNIIHHRLSDFFLVFNERRDSTTGGLLDRALVAKVTQMVAF